MRFLLICIFYISNLGGLQATTSQSPATISTNALQNFQANSPKVKQLLQFSLDLTRKDLTYRYGSESPTNGGMDCSGTVSYILKYMGITQPLHQADLLYQFANSKGKLYNVDATDFQSPQFEHLKPGDLLFWSGTYSTEPGRFVSHVMIYLGKDKKNHPLMVGASNGRTYQGRKIYGVSVFDFLLPAKNSSSHFLGYSCIPSISC